jgi:hypothetical protein
MCGGIDRGSLHHGHAGTDCATAAARHGGRTGSAGHGARAARRAAHARRPRLHVGLLLATHWQEREARGEREKKRGSPHARNDGRRCCESTRTAVASSYGQRGVRRMAVRGASASRERGWANVRTAISMSREGILVEVDAAPSHERLLPKPHDVGEISPAYTRKVVVGRREQSWPVGPKARDERSWGVPGTL